MAMCTWRSGSWKLVDDFIASERVLKKHFFGNGSSNVVQLLSLLKSWTFQGDQGFSGNALVKLLKVSKRNLSTKTKHSLEKEKKSFKWFENWKKMWSHKSLSALSVHTNERCYKTWVIILIWFIINSWSEWQIQVELVLQINLTIERSLYQKFS